jgi:hypothetical protein
MIIGVGLMKKGFLVNDLDKWCANKMRFVRPMLVISLFMVCNSSRVYAFDETKQPCASSIIELVGKLIAVNNFKPRDGDNAGVIIAKACKTLPTDSSKLITVIAYDSTKEFEKNFVVAIVDKSKQKVVSIYQNMIGEDAILTLGEGSLHIDTARYQLAQDIRAFGIDVETVYMYGGCYEGGIGPQRSLYVPTGDKIKQITDWFYLSDWSYTNGGSTCNGGTGDQSTEGFSYSIAVGNKSSKGMKNLQIIGKSSDRKRRPFTYMLRYDGDKYPTDGLQESLSKWRQ